MDLNTLYFVLYLLSIVCFLASTVGVAARINLVSLGLCFFAAVPFIQTLNNL